MGSTYRLHRVLMLTCIPGVFSGGRRPSISDDGKQASFTSGRDDVYLVDLEVSGPTAMAAGLSASIMLR